MDAADAPSPLPGGEEGGRAAIGLLTGCMGGGAVFSSSPGAVPSPAAAAGGVEALEVVPSPAGTAAGGVVALEAVPAVTSAVPAASADAVPLEGLLLDFTGTGSEGASEGEAAGDSASGGGATDLTSISA